MASKETYPERPRPYEEMQNPARVERVRGIAQRLRDRSAERKLARLVRPRNRRAVAEQLRRIACEANAGPRIRPGPDVLLHYRAAAVRTDLLEIAALLEQARDPDPACVNEIHELLASGDSPLYHPGVHVSELYASVYYLRVGLLPKHTGPKGACYA